MNLRNARFLSLYMRTSENISKYFFRCFLIGAIPTFALALISVYVLELRTPTVIVSGDEFVNLILEFVLAVGIYPFIESFVLTIPTSAVHRMTRSHYLAAIVGAGVIVSLHGLTSWQKPIIVLPIFFTQAFCFIQLRENGRSHWSAFLFVFGLHALFNAVAMLVGYFD